MITVGLRSDYVASYYAVPLMIRTGKSLIVDISFYGAVNYFTGPAYGAAKAGVLAFTRSLNRAEADHGVRATALCPGFGGQREPFASTGRKSQFKSRVGR